MTGSGKGLDAHVRLFAFPYAGASAVTAYSGLEKTLAPFVELIPLVLPTVDRNAPEAFSLLVEALLEHIVTQVDDRPYAFFGHSFGALLAYEVAAALHCRGAELPVYLFLSARRPLVDEGGAGPGGLMVHTLSDTGFLEVVRTWGLLTDEVLANPELLEIILPPLRADLSLDENYRPGCGGNPRLPIPCVVYGAREDRTVRLEGLHKWAHQFGTGQPFVVELFQGGHFYFHDAEAALCESMLRHIDQSFAGRGESIAWSGPADFMIGMEAGMTIGELFERQARSSPYALALEDQERRWTYRQLACSAAELAERMRAQGVGAQTVVGLLLPRSAEYVLAFLASSQIGATICLLESNWSDNLLDEFIEAAEVSLVVCPESQVGRMPTSRTLQLLPLKDREFAPPPVERAEALRFEASPMPPESIAIISMTSGSTGKPKAVFTTHRGCTYCFLARMDLIPYSEDGEREGLNVFFAWECLRPLVAGQAAVVIPDESILDPLRLLSLIESGRITRLVMTPSLLENILDYPTEMSLARAFAALRICILMGEVVSRRLVDKARRLLPAHVRLINAYSTWESLDVSYAEVLCTQGWTGASAPVGKVIAGTAVAIVGEDGHPVPRGMPGELYVTGPGIAPGYLGDERKTAERFVPWPAGQRDSCCRFDTAYRTGDRGRLLSDGSIVVSGRIDTTVKIRGFKVSLSAIESVLDEIDGVGKSVVVPVLDAESGQPQVLVAYLVGESGMPSESVLARARLHARRRLPEYAQPASFMGLNALPMMPGEARKLDRQALPSPVLTDREDFYNVPLSAFEQRIAAVWKTVLGVTQILPSDNFFELGGNSLSAARLVGDLAGQLGVSLAVVEVYQYSTLLAMAQRCRSDQGQTPAAQPRRPRKATTKLAVIGMACRAPGARSLRDFWHNLQNGTDSLTNYSREELKARGVTDEVLDHPRWVSVGQVVDDADCFDAPFWSIGQGEAAMMDPQHRLFMEVAWTALEEAGYARRDNPYRERTAVYAACGIDGYLIHHLEGGGLKAPLDPARWILTEIANEKDYIATRVAFQLDLGGPAATVTSACSSGLVAVAQAAQALMSGQCEMAIAGASALNFPNFGYCYEEGLVGSLDGRVRPFDENASGTLFGDAVGAVVLKRLDDALADGDKIWAVVAGYGMSNDGRQKAGYTAPNATAQTRCIVDAIEMAGISSDEVSYVECHATATHIGDAIELKGLTDAFAQTHRTEGAAVPCTIGSVKGNIGHANCAAGITGFIKTVLCLHHQQLVPSIHFREANAKLVDFIGDAHSPFQVGTALSPWVSASPEAPLRAGVSSFGIGGTNAHMILEQAPRQIVGAASDGLGFTRDSHLLCVSARSVSALKNNLENLAQALEAGADEDLANIAYTLQVAREVHPLRMAIPVGSGARDAAALLHAAAQGGSVTHPAIRTTVAFCFSGQGSQHVGMVRQFYEGNADGSRFRRHFQEVCEHLAPHLDGNPLELILNADEVQLRRPVVTQCGLFAVEWALASTLIDFGIQPVAVAGHSIGEYAAAVVAGVLDLADAARLVAARASACETLCLHRADGNPEDGAMLSVSGDEDMVRQWVAERDDVWLAVHNLPGQIVLSGLRSTLLAVEPELIAFGCRCVPVPVSHPFHSPLMTPVAERIAEAARGIQSRRPRLPMTSNISGTWMGDEVLAPDYWSRHLLATVQWTENVQTVLRWEPDVILEVGPSAVLTSLLGRLLALQKGSGSQTPLPLAAMRHMSSPSGPCAACDELLGRLWCEGITIDWKTYHQDEQPTPGVALRRVDLPTYAFDSHRYWVHPQASIYAALPASDASAADAALAASCLVRHGARTTPRMRLYCFPFAGGSSRHFRDWALRAPAWLEVVAIELPGRNGRAEEAMARNDAEDRHLHKTLGAAIRADAGGLPFALCGLSYGATLAGELLVQELSDLDQSGQCRGLVVVGRAPFVEQARDNTEEDLEGFLLVPDELRDNRFWQEWYRPILHADLDADYRATGRMAGHWRARGQSAILYCDLMVHHGTDDPACSPQQASAWAALTFGEPGGVRAYTGGHDFMLREEAVIFTRLLDWLGAKEGLDASGRGAALTHRVEWHPLEPVRVAVPAQTAPPWLACWVGAEAEALATLLDCLHDDQAIAGLVSLGLRSDQDGAAHCQGILLLLQALMSRRARGRLILLLPANGASGQVAGLARVATQELGDLSLRCVFSDTHPDLSGRQLDPEWVSSLMASSMAQPAESDLLWKGHLVLAPRLIPLAGTSMPRGVLGAARGHFLVTGGSGALGTALVDWLIDHQGVAAERLVVLSRRGASAPRSGVRYLLCDVADSVMLERTLTSLEPMQGVFHLAGVLDDCAFHNLDPNRLTRVLTPKMALSALMQQAGRWHSQWVLAYSSTSALLGAAGQANYAAANAWIDQTAQWPAASQPKLVSIAWGAWAEAGMAARSKRVTARAEKDNETPLATRDALDALGTVLCRLIGGGADGRYVVCDVDWKNSPWAELPLVANIQDRQSPPRAGSAPDALSDGAAGTARAAAEAHGQGAGAQSVRAFLNDYVSHWNEDLELPALGLDSLDLVQVRNGFNRYFGIQAPMSVFAAPGQKLHQLCSHLDALIREAVLTVAAQDKFFE